MTEEHYFTGHTNARLTFVIGIVIGMSIMTLTGGGFFAYVFFGGEVQSYAIAPLDTDSQILTEPIKTVTAEPAISLTPTATEYPITLVQYLDYECRFCKKFFPDVVELASAHSDTVRLVIKQYPLVQIHPNAKTASLAAMCAGQQDKLLDYSSQLYAQQQQLATGTIYDTIATDLGLNLEQFTSCRSAVATTAQLEADAAEAHSLGIQTQPNLVIIRSNGDRQLIDGYVNQAYLAGVLGL